MYTCIFIKLGPLWWTIVGPILEKRLDWLQWLHRAAPNSGIRIANGRVKSNLANSIGSVSQLKAIFNNFGKQLKRMSRAQIRTKFGYSSVPPYADSYTVTEWTFSFRCLDLLLNIWDKSNFSTNFFERIWRNLKIKRFSLHLLKSYQNFNFHHFKSIKTAVFQFLS